MTPKDLRKRLVAVRNAFESQFQATDWHTRDEISQLDAIINELPQIPERGDILEVESDDDEREHARVLVFSVDEDGERLHTSCMDDAYMRYIHFDDDFVIVGKVELPE